MREIALTNGGTAIVDDEDFAALAAFRWRRSPNGYAVRSEWSGGKVRAILMHRVVADPPDGKEVDHVDGNKLLNTRANLRVCERGQNAANTAGRRRRKSPFKGTDYRAAKKRWRASINVKGKNIHLGYFDTAEGAARAYDSAAREHFGEFAHLNFAAA